MDNAPIIFAYPSVWCEGQRSHLKIYIFLYKYLFPRFPFQTQAKHIAEMEDQNRYLSALLFP